MSFGLAGPLLDTSYRHARRAGLGELLAMSRRAFPTRKDGMDTLQSSSDKIEAVQRRCAWSFLKDDVRKWIGSVRWGRLVVDLATRWPHVVRACRVGEADGHQCSHAREVKRRH